MLSQNTLKIDFVIYPFEAHVLLCESQAQLSQFLQSHKVQINDVSAIFQAKGWCVSLQNGGALIIINKHRAKDFIDFTAIVRHEVSHACAHCFQFICQEIYKLDDEFVNYLNDFVYKKIVSFFKSFFIK